MSSPPSRFAAEALGGEGGEVIAPAFMLLDAELVEIVPGKDAGVVQIVELDPDGVVADRLQFEDADMGALADDRLLPGAVPLQFGRRAFDPQIFGRQAETLAVIEFDVEALFGAFEAQLDRPGPLVAHWRFITHNPSYRRRPVSTSPPHEPLTPRPPPSPPIHPPPSSPTRPPHRSTPLPR